MLSSAVPIAVAVYVPVTIVALVVLWLQWRFPERPSWRPGWSDVKADIAFMALVQLALPETLLAAFAPVLADNLGPGAAEPFWPHSAPLFVQTCLMLLAVDCMRYWLHRACHRFPLLWRLHAVHHSPELLYSLNSGRFHPLEKVLHFCVDTVPFIVLGVAPEVIAGYFVIYTANGLFQHSNVRLNYGWLNYFVGSAETHRWHHARDPHLAACNFGSSTAVWDVIFGTWHLPKDRHVEEVGIMDKAYPRGFIEQLVAPFRDRHGAPSHHAPKRWLANVLVTMRLRLTLLIQGLRIAVAVRDPMRVQRALLERIIRGNRHTAFGRQYQFGKSGSYEAFARNVPVSDYEALRPYIDAEIERGESALTDEAPQQYVRTSGSTGSPKDVPLVPGHLDALRRIHETSVAFQYRNCPAAFGGSILAIVSPAREGALRSGKPFGSASGIVAGNTPRSVQEKFVVPAVVFTVSDSRVKYLLILRFALAHRDITYIGTANSTTLLALMRLYREHWPALIDDLRRGTFFLEEQTPAATWSVIRSRLQPCPRRADELTALHAALGNPRIADLWPSVHAVVTWTCASAGAAVSALRRELSPETRVLELGYVASEFRATITLGRRAGAGLPTLDTHFFEFAERDRWDRGEREVLTLDRIRKGVDYYIMVTTPSGLYRYFINDIVRVTGFIHRTPLLKFMQKGKGVTNLTGEKLYECQVISAVRAAMSEIGRALCFVMMLADEETGKYHLYVEPDAGVRPSAARLAQAVDARLARLNIEYQAKRESERLGEIDGHWLHDQTGEAFKRFCVGNGQREGQYKPIALAYRKGLGFDFDRFVEAP
jgi:sterol desaturase/sphingolipid hydroxylase (fatty acid hydroxylase superfamily)